MQLIEEKKDSNRFKIYIALREMEGRIKMKLSDIKRINQRIYKRNNFNCFNCNNYWNFNIGKCKHKYLVWRKWHNRKNKESKRGI